MRVFWDAWNPIYQPIMSDFRKTYFQKRPIFSEGARAVSVYFLDPGQTVEPLDSIGVYFDFPRPDLFICEVKNQKKLKP